MGKTCSKCNQLKELSEYRLRKDSKKGLRDICKDCYKKRDQEYRDMNRERTRQYHKNYIDNYRRTEHGYLKNLYNLMKFRIKRFWKCEIIHEELFKHIYGKGICSVSGIKFIFNDSSEFGKNPFSPSIDRIQNDKGYNPDNIRFVCNIINTAKSDHSDLDFIAVCMAVAEHNKSNLEAKKRMKELVKCQAKQDCNNKLDLHLLQSVNSGAIIPEAIRMKPGDG